MPLPTKEAAIALLHDHVNDGYQRLHALMVATAMEGYAQHFNEDPLLWFITGLLHDIDFEQHPDSHPGPSLGWFKDWGYPDALIHAVEATPTATTISRHSRRPSSPPHCSRATRSAAFFTPTGR